MFDQVNALLLKIIIDFCKKKRELLKGSVRISTSYIENVSSNKNSKIIIIKTGKACFSLCRCRVVKINRCITMRMWTILHWCIIIDFSL